MTVERIRILYNARPFNPFVITTADGKVIAVTHPEWMLFSPSGRTITVEDRHENLITIDLLLVTTVEVRKNGRSPARRRN